MIAGKIVAAGAGMFIFSGILIEAGFVFLAAVVAITGIATVIVGPLVLTLDD